MKMIINKNITKIIGMIEVSLGIKKIHTMINGIKQEQININIIIIIRIIIKEINIETETMNLYNNHYMY